jgi:fibronectin-binding autotransporter adhesin
MRMLRFLLLVACAGLLWVSSANAVVVKYWVGLTPDVTVGTNWSPTGAPSNAEEGRFNDVGSTTPNVPAAGWNPLYISFASTPSYTIQGPGVITIASNGNIDSYTSTGNVIFSNAGIDMTRAAGIYASSGGIGTANVNINTTTFRMGVGGSSGHPYLRAYGANISVTPTVDFSGSTSNRYLYATAYAGKTITLAGGVAGPKLLRLYADGQAAGSGGTVVLGNSTTWAGLTLIYNADLEINHNNSLGAVGTLGPSYASYTEFNAGAGSGALVLTNNITSNESIFLVGRNTSAAEIRNKSGHNILSGKIGGEGAAAADGNLYTLESAGTAVGDLFEISGTISPTTLNTGAYNLVLRGAGDGLVSGTISATPIVITSGTFDGGTIGLTKDGAGTWTLTGTNTYTGPTVVANGTLSLGPYVVSGPTGSIANSPTIDVKSGAFFKVSDLSGGGYTLAATQTLQGTGTVTGSITANGITSQISPAGAGIAGTLNITGNLSLSGSQLNYDLFASAKDKIIVGGSLSANTGAPTTINVAAPNGYLGNGNYRLIDYVGAAVNTAAFTVTGITPTYFPAGRTQTVAFSSTTNQLNLNVSGMADLTWVGTNEKWDVTTSSVNGTANWTGAADQRFWNADSVTFSDSAATFTPMISGTNGLVQPGNVSFTNSSAHPYTFSADSPEHLGGALSVLGEFTASGSGDATFVSTDISLLGPVNIGGTGNITFGNANLTISGALAVNGGKLTIANTGTLTMPSTVAVNSGTLAFNRDLTTALSNALSNAFTGSGTLRKEGASSTVELTGNNSGFTGTVEVAAGTLKTTDANSLGTAAGGTTVLDGATVDVGNNGAMTPGGGTEVFTIAGTGASGTGALTVAGAANTAGHVGGIILAGDAKIAAIGIGIDTNYRSILWVDGPITGNGKNLDVVIDNGMSNASGTEIDWIGVGNTNLANITVAGGGVLYLGGNSTIDQTTPGTITLKDKGRLGIYGSAAGSAWTGTLTKPITVDATTNGGGIEDYLGNATVAAPITLDGMLDLNTYSSSGTSVLTLAGKISGVGGMTMHQESNSSTTSRRGMVQLTSDLNDFTGPVTVGGGGGFGGISAERDRISLSVGDGGTTGSLGKGDVTFYGIGGTSPYNGLYFNRSGAYTVTNNITFNGAAGMARLWPIHVDGKPTFTGMLSGSGNILVDGGVTTIAGVMDAGFGWVDARGLNGPAILQFAKQVSLYNNDTSKWTSANVNAEGNGTLAFNVGGTGEFTAADIDLLQVLGTASDGFMNGAGIGFDTTNAAGGNFAYGTVLADPNLGANVRNLIKLGANTLSLTSDPTYTGSTTVTGGTLDIAGNLDTPLATISVANDATLKVDWLKAATLSIGNAPAAAAIPEPSTILLLSLAGIVGLLAWRRNEK